MLYKKGKSAAGLISIVLTALTFSVSANAKEPNPLATIMRDAVQQSTFDQPAGVSNTRLLKLMRDSVANNRGAGICGDESPDAGEECDDGNLDNLDGCDSTCMVEAGSDCTAAIAGVDSINVIDNGNFEDGPVVWTEASTGITFGPISSPLNCGGCNLASDGEWWVWMGGWPLAATTSSVDQDVLIPTNATTIQLDIWEGNCIPDNGTGDFVSVRIDGTEVFNTGTCTTEDFYAQADTTISLTSAAAIAACGGTGCNDGAVHNIEIFSDMDLNPGDSQTGSILIDNVRLNTPLLEPIPPVPSSCLVGICGDGILSSGESCDDGNNDDFDGCDATCNIEEDTWVCVNDQADTALDVLNGSLSTNNDVTDGSLEQGSPNPDWVEAGTVFTPICSEAFCGAAVASDGDFFGWFGGASEPNSQTLTQTTIISADATDLTFDFLVGTCDSAADVFRVSIGGNVEFEYFCIADTPAYASESISLSAYADGGEYDIVFSADTFAAQTGNSNFFVDNIAISYGITPDRAPNPSDCFELDGVCGIGVPARGIGDTGFGIEKFEAGLGIMSAFEIGTLSAANNWTTTADEWTAVLDPSGCGTADLSVANWSGGNRTGGSGEAACADADGGAESLANPDAAAACINAVDPTLTCQTKAYLCTPALDTTNMTDPGVTATVHYQTAAQDFDTPDFDDDELFRVLVGEPINGNGPSGFTIATYRSAGRIFDHNSNTLASSPSATIGVNLDDFRNPAEQGCVDPLEDPPCTISGVEAPLGDTMYVCFEYAGIYSWYGQVDNVASRADNCTVGDADFDLVPDDVDNCILVANADQRDTDFDDVGNACDADIDGVPGCSVLFTDSLAYRSAFFGNNLGPNPTPNWNPDSDNNGDGITNFVDLQLLAAQFFGPPGPSAIGCN